MKENVNTIDTNKIGIWQLLKKVLWADESVLEEEEKLPPELQAVREKWDKEAEKLNKREAETHSKADNLMKQNLKVKRDPQIQKSEFIKESEEKVEENNNEKIQEI